MSEIEERSDGAWRPSPGAVYPALPQLADEGLIEGEESGGRRTFQLTDAGRRYVEENPEMARPAWESMAQGESGEVPGLFVAAARLGGGIVQMARESPWCSWSDLTVKGCPPVPGRRRRPPGRRPPW